MMTKHELKKQSEESVPMQLGSHDRSTEDGRYTEPKEEGLSNDDSVVHVFRPLPLRPLTLTHYIAAVNVVLE